MTFNIPDEIDLQIQDGMVRFSFDGHSTDWMGRDDFFIKRIDRTRLNSVFLKEHLVKEIEIKNVLDEGAAFLESEKPSKAICLFDEVIFYDSTYGEALFYKSRALFLQRHFVKSLRFYKKAVGTNPDLKDIDFYRLLLDNANEERSGFSKLKENIYAGDEYFAKGDYVRAVESYDRALKNPSRFKEKILFRLLNKKGKALLKMDEFTQALDCFASSAKAKANDYAYFGEGVCRYSLKMEIPDEFKRLLKIEKIHMLRQVLILNDLEFFEESLAICDYLMKNHFTADEFYFKLLNAKIHALNGLNRDFSDVEEVLRELF